MEKRKSLKEIEMDFRLSLKVPPLIKRRQFFFCPVGLVGAGKTTVTKPISKKFKLLRLSSDELRKMLKEAGYDYSAMKDIGFRIAKEFAHKGYSIAFDMDCGNLEVKKLVESLAKELHATVIWVHVNTPEAYIFEKFEKHPASWLASDPQVMTDNYLAQKEKRAKEKTRFDFLCIFDTSKPDIAKQLDDCCTKISKLLEWK